MQRTPHLDIANASPVIGIDPVNGWILWSFDEADSDGFFAPAYFARGEREDVLLSVSRFRFSPSQERFAWLVRNGFPRRPGKILAAWDDTEIEERIAAERLAA